MNNIYKLRFGKSSFELEKHYNTLSDSQKERISSMKPVSFFDFNDNQSRYTLFMIITPGEIKEYTAILDSNDIPYSIDNISDSLIRNSIDLDDYIMENATRGSRSKAIGFIEKKNQWVYENLDIDTVLDRISDVGMDSLSSIEKKFLKNYTVE